MAAVAIPPTPISTSKVDDMKPLGPLKVRTPYTPPPQKEDDTISKSRQMSRNDDDTNGEVEVDMKGLRLDNVEASAGQKRKSKRGNNAVGDSLAGMLRKGIVGHQLGLSLNVILLVALSWFLFPSIREKLEASFTLSYRVRQAGIEGAGLHGQGPRDLWLVASLVVVFTGVRAFTLDHVLMPLAALLGIWKKKGRVRYVHLSL